MVKTAAKSNKRPFIDKYNSGACSGRGSQSYSFDSLGLGNMTLKTSTTENTNNRILGDPLDYRLDYEYDPN